MILNICQLILLFQSIDAFLYNQICTFSSGTCQWSVGRRWHVVQLNVDDQILVADGESEEDKRIGFTDAIMSPWLQLSGQCALTIRLTFQFSIENPDDFIEIYLIHENRTRLSSLGQWKGTNTSDEFEAPWQHANLTFTAAEKFRIDIEVRHLPDRRNRTVAWFAIDDILIENCPIPLINAKTRSTRLLETITTIKTTTTTTTTLSSTSISMINENVSVSEWKLTNNSAEDSTLLPRHTLLSFILYLLCALIALTLLIILLTILIYTYRKQCCPSSSSGREMRRRRQQRIGIQIDKSSIVNNSNQSGDVRPCF